MGHGVSDWKCPDWRQYKVAGTPQVEEYANKLKMAGLKDPWIRSTVWQFHPKLYRTKWQIFTMTFTRGLPVGAALFALTIGLEYAYNGMQTGETKKH